MGQSTQAKWARSRFSVVGTLLACPPKHGSLRSELQALSSKLWTHPITGESVRFSLATIERWYYIARSAGTDPVGALRPNVRKDRSTNPSLSPAQRQSIRKASAARLIWSCQRYDPDARRQRRSAIWAKGRRLSSASSREANPSCRARCADGESTLRAIGNRTPSSFMM